MKNFFKENWRKLVPISIIVIGGSFLCKYGLTPLFNYYGSLLSAKSENHESESCANQFSIKCAPIDLPMVVYYGKMKRHSPSGMLAFYYYDIKKDQLEEPDNPRHWFWATIYPDDPRLNELIEVVSGDEAWDRIYKITGLKQEDDIGYYDEGFPVGDIIVKNIEQYK